MALLNNLYVQSLSAPLPPQDSDNPKLFHEKIERLARQVCQADAIVVGVGSGLSAAAGHDFYHGSEQFDEAFASFERAHGFKTLFDGMYHVFGSNEEQWALNAAVAQYVRGLPTGAPYLELARALEGTEHFVLTTNVDGQASRVFDPDRLFLFQGDLRYWQCSQPCCSKIVDNRQLAEGMVRATVVGDDGVPRVAYDDLPRCPECGWLMAPWIRDVNFLEGDLWHEQEERYANFLTEHLVDRQDKVLFLELGVSSMTPAIIKMPFWSMCAKNAQTEHVSINKGKASAPSQLGSRASVITADLSLAIGELLRALEGRRRV